ncbi:hypothetical protein DM292_02520 [Stutzerimonas frequens]|uniref:hypothetical protein n=1 Tax=Stutzerimonas frequens TaxID=2968969 RepID=UPI000D7DF3C3|nr:hypothetical protein [Stutzerimonas frequens]AWT09169.1 hypothetical protein DM292_02520 [Stutzerimonas frequens]
MARSTMEVAFLGTQKLAFSQNGSEVKIVKVFYGDEPDGQTENGLSIVSMDVPLEVADEVFASGANFEPLETVRIHFEVARAGKQKGNNLCLHLESVKPATQAAKPTQQPTPTAKPSGTQPEPAKAN